MAKSKASLLRLALVSGLTLAWAVLATPTTQAGVYEIGVQLKDEPSPGANPGGAGFSGILWGYASDLTVTLNAPLNYLITSSQVYSSGESIWEATGGGPLPALSQQYQVFGIRRDDDHSVTFNGTLSSSSGSGQGGQSTTPPGFDQAIADVRFDGHDVEESEGGGGLGISPSSSGTTVLHVTPQGWSGAANTGSLGKVKLSWVTNGIDHLTYSGGTLYNGQEIPVSSAGLNEQITIYTNSNLTDSDTLKAEFTWVSPFVAEGVSQGTAAQDQVRVEPIDVVITVTYPGSTTHDDLVEVTSTVPPQIYWVPATAKLSGANAGFRSVVLTNPDHRLGFAASGFFGPEGAPASTLTLLLGGGETRFYIAGNSSSNVIRDAVIVPTSGTMTYTSHPMTVFSYSNAGISITPVAQYRWQYDITGNLRPVVRFSGQATIQPDGMNKKATILTNLRLGLVQNGASDEPRCGTPRRSLGVFHSISDGNSRANQLCSEQSRWGHLAFSTRLTVPLRRFTTAPLRQ